VSVRADLDLRHEPAFVGDLSVDVRGVTPSGAEAFALTVKVSVRPGATP